MKPLPWAVYSSESCNIFLNIFKGTWFIFNLLRFILQYINTYFLLKYQNITEQAGRGSPQQSSPHLETTTTTGDISLPDLRPSQGVYQLQRCSQEKQGKGSSISFYFVWIISQFFLHLSECLRVAFSEAPRFPREGHLIFSTMNCYSCNSCQAMDCKADFHFFSSVCKQSRRLKPRRICSTWVSCDMLCPAIPTEWVVYAPFRYFQVGVHEPSGLTS